MKVRQRTELGTFSASAIDLFASALGAFIIIAVVLFPYFPTLEESPLKAIIAALQGKNAGLEKSVANQKKHIGNLTDQNTSLQSKVDSQAAAITQKDNQIAAAQAQASKAQAQASALAGSTRDKDKEIEDLKDQLSGTAFIGIEPKNKNFQLVLDMSGSIEDYRGNVQKVVDEILTRMDSSYNLRILTYQGPVTSPLIKRWPSGGGFQNGISASEKQAAASFLHNSLNNVAGYTPTFKALEVAFSESDSTTIFLITDGIPQISPSDDDAGASAQSIRSEVNNITSVNSGRHQLNMIAIGGFVTKQQAADQVQAMIPLATKNEGVVVAMP